MAFVFLMTAVITVSADEQIVFDGEAADFIVVHQPVDDEGNVIRVMPGDVAKRQLTVSSEAARGVKATIYVRPLVKVVLDGSTVEEYLPDVNVFVEKSVENRMAYMFDFAAEQYDASGEWLLLGTIYSGGEVNLDLTLEFPITLGNEYQDADFYLEFKIQEFPKEPDDPLPPQTGDSGKIVIFACAATVAGVLVLIPILSRRRRDNEVEE